MTGLPAQIITGPDDCQLNWDFLQPKLTNDEATLDLLTYISKGIYAQSTSNADEGSISTSYADLTTAGPSITIPIAGNWIIELFCRAFNSAAGAHNYMSYALNAGSASDTTAAEVCPGVSNTDVLFGYRYNPPTAFAAGDVLACKYRVTAGTGNWRGTNTVGQPRAIKATLAL